MRLVCSDYGLDMELEENRVTVLTVENAKFITEIIGSLKNQITGEEGMFVLSDHDKIQRIDKKMNLIIDPFDVSINDRKIINKLHSRLGIIAPDYFQEKEKITADIISLLDEIVLASPFSNLIYNLDYDWTEMFKGFNIRFEETGENLIEKLVEFIRIQASLLEIRVLCFVNLKSYLIQEELQELYKAAFYNKINLVLIESIEKDKLENEQIYIVDKDRCLIVK